jgi:hypothetical protein
MRFRAIALLGTCVVASAIAAAPAKPRTYALLSAMGNTFEVITERESVGSHLPPYDRRVYQIGQNLLNRMVLSGLDQAVARLEPDSRRVYLSTSPARRASQSETATIDAVIEQLRKLDRAQWDRILVAAPAYRHQAKDGLAMRMQGAGVFVQPLCQSDMAPGRINSCEYGFRPPSGPMSLTPEGDTIAANSFAAPYSFVQIWVLDPKTLEVLDRSSSFQHRKLTDASGNLGGNLSKGHAEFLNAQLVDVIQLSVGDAVEATIQRGTVEVQEKGPVK